MFGRLLIANRGEIALRIIRTCRELGVESVAVYSDVDATAVHVAAADRAEAIGPAAPAESYLSVSQIIDAARRSGAEAIHPGYGFLAESQAFAEACRDANLVFVGPSPEVIARAGSKIEARRLAESVGVPVVPGGTPDDQTVDGLRAAVAAVGYPALLKPSAGGGGKGMRIVPSAEEAAAAIGATRREAEAAFGDGSIYVERLVDHPRHIEVQIAGDQHGRIVHLFERECSVQRRYQKVIEECPSPAISESTRAALTTAATTVATAAGYNNVGTVEFLVEGDGPEPRFYFLEMNTRLQVEHPVTELCTGVDLVRGQLELAAGLPMPWTQAALSLRGHAIECRVYAEDPAQDFLPQAGQIQLYREPSGPGLRVDAGVAEGSLVPVQYDPLLAKLVATAEQREWARRRAVEALRRYAILGVTTNVDLLLRVLEHPTYVDRGVDTAFLNTERAMLTSPPEGSALVAAVAAAAVHRVRSSGTPTCDGGRRRPVADPWTSLTDWRLHPTT